ncbi:hypothetical protein IV498_16930 [Paenarthrobacter sp. Z7-10]|uniref:hypothetical protein n=1 Tax=Paenarthrobacter sp. Z7-10 TaxID=2787635 RepID=UPI0022A8EE78|nr:hypothetical protein [Paenarthrobacter sp. Z7-10]MCZ2404812.1 hypothetical protein [Paenarthrobacter sp. Z7-10]
MLNTDRIQVAMEVALPRNRIPLREQGFRIFSYSLGLLIAIAIMVLLPVLSGRAVHPGAVLVLVVIVLVFAVPAVLIGQRMGNRLTGDRVEVALRRPNGGWQHGRVTVSRAHLSFQPYRWQIRIPHGRPIELQVSELGEDTGRRPPLRQIWSINPQLRIIDVATDQGPKELAALPSQIKELRDRLTDSRTPEPS